MAELTVQAIGKSGLDLLANLTPAAAGGDTVKAASGLLFVVNNQDGSPHTVSLPDPGASINVQPYGFQDISQVSITVPAGEARYFAVTSGYAADGVYSLSYDDVTSVSVGVFSVSGL